MGEVTPWWIAAASGIVVSLAGVVGKLWASSREEVRTLRADNAQLRHELAEANAEKQRLQEEATERGEGLQREHLKDLRRLTGLSTSMDPPPMGAWPPTIVRPSPAKARPQQRKRSKVPPEPT